MWSSVGPALGLRAAATRGHQLLPVEPCRLAAWPARLRKFPPLPALSACCDALLHSKRAWVLRVCLSSDRRQPPRENRPSFPAPLRLTPRLMLPAGNRQMISGLGASAELAAALAIGHCLPQRGSSGHSQMVKTRGWPSPYGDGSLSWELRDYGVQSPTDGEICDNSNENCRCP